MGTLKDLLDAVGTAATNAVLKERLNLFVEEAQRMEKENERLQKRTSDLEEQLRAALQELATSRKAEEFVEHCGAMFKRTGSGYVKSVYCPVCKVSVGSLEGIMPYYCQRCRWMADFTGNELEAIMAGLPK